MNNFLSLSVPDAAGKQQTGRRLRGAAPSRRGRRERARARRRAGNFTQRRRNPRGSARGAVRRVARAAVGRDAVGAKYPTSPAGARAEFFARAKPGGKRASVDGRDEFRKERAAGEKHASETNDLL